MRHDWSGPVSLGGNSTCATCEAVYDGSNGAEECRPRSVHVEFEPLDNGSGRCGATHAAGNVCVLPAGHVGVHGDGRVKWAFDDTDR